MDKGLCAECDAVGVSRFNIEENGRKASFWLCASCSAPFIEEMWRPGGGMFFMRERLGSGVSWRRIGAAERLGNKLFRGFRAFWREIVR